MKQRVERKYERYMGSGIGSSDGKNGSGDKRNNSGTKKKLVSDPFFTHVFHIFVILL